MNAATRWSEIEMLAAHGLHAFPCVWPIGQRCSCADEKCENIAKHPKIKGWQQYATTETDILSQWAKTWPLANWGIVAGLPSGVIVVDIDPRHGGDDTLSGLQAQHGGL